MKVEEVMRKPLIVEKDIALDKAASLMNAHQSGSLLLVVNGDVKGIITERDILKNFHKHKKISKIMSILVFSISPDSELQEALDIMRDKKVKRLPVIDDGKVVGIITITSILAHWEELGIEEPFFFN